MAIVFWLFLLLSPILWIISFVLLLIKSRPLTFLLNFVMCAVVIYLVWAGVDEGARTAPASSGGMWLDEIGDTAGSIVDGLKKGFISLLVAAGWGMSLLIYSSLCSKAQRPELELLLGSLNGRTLSAPAASSTATAGSQPGPAKRSNLIVYLILGAIVLYFLARQAEQMGL